MHSLGIEMEMPVASKLTGEGLHVGPYFQNLLRLKQERGEEASLEYLQGIPVAVHADGVISGVDNAFNNLESAIGPLYKGRYPLGELHALIQRELTDVATALAMEDATILNFSEHPDVRVTPEFYKSIRSPKPVYDYWVDYRGWLHMAGVDAKAHNGPTTGVAPEEAVRALNLILAASPVFIALYANSPFEAGELTGYKENRLTIWTRMFGSSRFDCDRRFISMPPEPFRDFGHYFSWFFGPGTNMQFLVDAPHGDYKKSGRIVVVDQDPPFLDFLSQPRSRARVLKTGEELWLRPSMQHFEFLQFSHFLDCRIRFGLKEGLGEEAPDSLMEALRTPGGMDAFFSRSVAFCYIEGRVAGANFPDSRLVDLADADVARSVVISPTALQAGLLQNMDAAEKVLKRASWPKSWEALRGLREAAIKDGLSAEHQGLRVIDLARDLVEAARGGLDAEAQWMLSYPEHVLATGRNGADNAMRSFERATGDRSQRLKKVIQERMLRAPGAD
jgi:hypothetical protein